MAEIERLTSGVYQVREIHVLDPSPRASVEPAVLVFAWLDNVTIGKHVSSFFEIVWGDYTKPQVEIFDDRAKLATLFLSQGDRRVYRQRNNFPERALVSGKPNAIIESTATLLSGGIGGGISK